MKATTYKTGNVMKSIVASLIILASFSGIVNGENSSKEAIEIVENESALQAASCVKYNAAEFVEAEVALETENWMNSNTETKNEVLEAETALQIKEYNAKDFVTAEMVLEIENWMNNNGETDNEAVEAEPVIQIAALMSNMTYKAEKFVEAEMAVEIESWKNTIESKEQTNYSNGLAAN